MDDNFNLDDVDINNLDNIVDIYDTILKFVGKTLVDAIDSGEPEMIDMVITMMEKAHSTVLKQVESEEKNLNPVADEMLKKLIAKTRIVEELFNDDKTTVEEYETFHNKLIASFIEEEIDTKVKPKKKSAKDLIPGSDVPRNIKVLYKRVYTGDGTNGNRVDAIPGLSLLLWDMTHKRVMPISFAVHEGLAHESGERFTASCMTDEGKSFIGDLIIEYTKSNPDALDGFDKVNEDVSGLQVAPQVITPGFTLCRRLLDETKQESELNVADVFADINPDDFA